MIPVIDGPSPGPGPSRLQILVAVDGPFVPAAIARTVDLVVALPTAFVEIVFHQTDAPRSWAARLASLLDTFDRRVFRLGPDATNLIDLRLEHAARLTKGTSSAAGSENRPLDIVVDLTSFGLSLPDRPRVRLGTLFLRFGAERRSMGPEAFVADFARGATAAIIEVLMYPPASDVNGPTAHVLYRSIGSIDRHSPARTRNASAWRASELPARVMRNGIASDLTSRSGLEADRSPKAKTPGIAMAFLASWRMLARAISEWLRRIGGQPSWFVAVRVGREGSHAPPDDLHGFVQLAAPNGRFYADPCLVRTPTGALLFVEDGPIGGAPARISAIDLDEAGRPRSEPIVVLERETHLSYPFVFKDGEDWYLAPETSGTHTVELFKARPTLGKWDHFATILRGIDALDPTIIQHEGLYWLFVSVATPGSSPSDELALFWSRSLAGEWQPHRGNPVISDARRARPAGRILLGHDGVLIRPSQDCTGGYGRRIVLNRIDLLNPDEYREVPIGSIEPRGLKGVQRTHTYSRDGQFEALDGLAYLSRVRVDRSARSINPSPVA